jgi:endonuclease III
MKSKKQINYELLVIHWLYPSDQTELHRETPFQLLIAVVLSAQTTDKQVNKVISILFQIIKHPQDIIDLWENNLKEIIKSIWFFNNKAKNIYTLSWQLLSENYWWNIPNDIRELVKFPWVGIKTAKVVTHQLYGANYIAVDTHVHRVCNRLGWVSTTNPEQTNKHIEWLFYKTNIYLAHHCIILFGRYLCKARKPDCDKCPLYENCIYYKQQAVWKNK